MVYRLGIVHRNLFRSLLLLLGAGLIAAAGLGRKLKK
jgi:hypothetical protein